MKGVRGWEKRGLRGPVERNWEATVRSPGLLGVSAHPGSHLQSPIQPRHHADSVRTLDPLNHLSNRPDLPGRNRTRMQTGERAQRAAAPPGAHCLFSTSQPLRTAGATGQMAGGRCEPSRWQAIRPQTMAREMSEVSGKGCGGTAG